MASSLTKSIMKNISQKAPYKNNCNSYEDKSNLNINREEEEILKNILNKNNNKKSLKDLSSNNIKDNVLNSESKINQEHKINENRINKVNIRSLSSLNNKNEGNSNMNLHKDKNYKKIVSLKDLAK